MLSIQELFYGDCEELCILKPEKKEKQSEEEKKENKPPPKPTPVEDAFGPFYPYPFRVIPPAPPPKPEQPKGPPGPKKVELKVVSCSECLELVTLQLPGIKGVKKDSVKVDSIKGKVTVEFSPPATEDTLLLETRKAYEKTRLWTKDD